MYINAVYYPNWRVYRNQPPSSLNFGMISHVFYAFAKWVTPSDAVVKMEKLTFHRVSEDGSIGVC
jgi:chitinase